MSRTYDSSLSVIVSSGAVQRLWAASVRLYVWIFLVTMPIWNLKFLPGVYSATSPYLGLPLGLLFIVGLAESRKLNNKHLICFLLLATSSVLYSMLLFWVYSGTALIRNLLVGVGGWVVAALLYFACIFSIRVVGFLRFVDLQRKITLLLVLYGVIELFLKTVLSGFLVNQLSLLISGEESERIILTTSEPSFAVQLVMFSAPFLLYHYDGARKNSRLVWAALAAVFLACMSMTGIVVLVASVFFYYIVILGRAVKALLFVIAMGGVLVWVILILPPAPDGAPYYIARLYKLAEVLKTDLGSLFFAVLNIDGSLQVRLGYPYLAVKVFLDHPLGIGFGQFGTYFPEYVHFLRDNDFSDTEIPGHILSRNADTRNMYLRMLVEGGLFIFILFLFFISQIVRYVRRLRDPRLFKLCARLLAVTLAVMIHFTTIYFAYYWLIFAFIFEARRYERRTVVAQLRVKIDTEKASS